MSNKLKTEYSVILGIGQDTKPHAARFAVADHAAVAKAAELMDCRVGKAITEPAVKLAAKLPRGKLFDSGKALVPLVKVETYYSLLNALSFDEPVGPAETAAAAFRPDQPPAIADALSPWLQIKVGSVVLAPDLGEYAGWYEAVVLAISKDNRKLTVRFRDWPKDKAFGIARDAVAVLPEFQDAAAR